MVTSADRNVPNRLPTVERAYSRPATDPTSRTSSIASLIANGATIPSRITGGAKSASTAKNDPIAAPAET